MRLAVNLALVGALCAAVLAGAWHLWGAVGLVYAMPVLALLAMPLVEILAELPRLAHVRPARNRRDGTRSPP